MIPTQKSKSTSGRRQSTTKKEVEFTMTKICGIKSLLHAITAQWPDFDAMCESLSFNTRQQKFVEYGLRGEYNKVWSTLAKKEYPIDKQEESGTFTKAQ